MRLDDLSKFPLADDELIIVLSNLIDNAIEACEKVSDESKRYVLLKMRVEEQASFSVHRKSNDSACGNKG